MNNCCYINDVICSSLKILDYGGICTSGQGNIKTAGRPVRDAEIVLGDPHVHRSAEAQGDGAVA